MPRYLDFVEGNDWAEVNVLAKRLFDYSCLKVARLASLGQAVMWAEQNSFVGDLVECGCFRGGSAAMMGLCCPKRRLWLFDSFEGLPPASEVDGRRAQQWTGACRSSEDEIRGFLEDEGLSRFKMVKGWFKDTLPPAKPEQIAVLHIDVDWYESTKSCLEGLYDRVVPGGVVQIDDYQSWPGARKAVDEFLETHQPQEMRIVDVAMVVVK